ncbi:hypothetical protein [Actinomadura violacea]|uniref:Uncharacterized protein n=1 Tax=Actinomadura violacea TaxID=2819934 RepID=A0ABS3RWP8_9ACTN|nr:hypothetical protein [Actinomadura violacea]MBO2461180.1 hypothetical protein [Actinomadura violacea]
MVVYATISDLENYLVTIPVWPGADRHLQQASEDIDELLIGAVYDVDDDHLPTDPRIADAIKRATCAQAHYIRERGDETGGKAQFTNVSVGSISYSRNRLISESKARTSSKYADRALTILKTERLLPVSPRTY